MDSVIEEDYSDSFEDSVPKSGSGSAIEEDLPSSSNSKTSTSLKPEKRLKIQLANKGGVPAVGAVGGIAKLQQKNSGRDKKGRDTIADSQSIIDEVIDEVSNLN